VAARTLSELLLRRGGYATAMIDLSQKIRDECRVLNSELIHFLFNISYLISQQNLDLWLYAA